MIQTANSDYLVAQLSADFIIDKAPLIGSAGFAPNSVHAGQPRQTFSLALSTKTIASVRAQVQPLYDQIIRDCWPAGEPIAFDMLRFDAFLDPISNDLKILEINTRNVGLHEVVEWLDATVAKQLDTAPSGSLNRRFVQNQKVLHDSAVGAGEPLLYMCPDFIPRWTYLEELRRAYSSVKHITAKTEYTETDEGLMVDGQRYRAITKKLAWGASDSLKTLNTDKQVRIMQPLWMRPIGLKNYLQQLQSPTVLHTETYTAEHLDRYRADKDQLVLKIANGGNSKSVFLGGQYDQADWERKLAAASQLPEDWIVQDYYDPPKHAVIAHGIGPRTLPTQLGIFVLPCPDNPSSFDMDITLKAYAGPDQHFTFDPSGLNPDIWFGQVVKLLQ